MKNRLERRYGHQHLHFITCSCYRRLPLLRPARARDVFLKILDQVRTQYQFLLVGVVIMPEHFHLLMGGPPSSNPSRVLQVLKQRVSRKLRSKRRQRNSSAQLRLWQEPVSAALRCFWQRRFYDFNVWSQKKKAEKLHYMHMNPVKRGLVTHPNQWPWSSHCFYAGEETRIPFDRLD
jgi:putative transposase